MRVIVDPRFAEKDYRDFQNYVGESYTFGKEIEVIEEKIAGAIKDVWVSE